VSTITKPPDGSAQADVVRGLSVGVAVSTGKWFPAATIPGRPWPRPPVPQSGHISMDLQEIYQPMREGSAPPPGARYGYSTTHRALGNHGLADQAYIVFSTGMDLIKLWPPGSSPRTLSAEASSSQPGRLLYRGCHAPLATARLVWTRRATYQDRRVYHTQSSSSPASI
jgi:hypothetical protein